MAFCESVGQRCLPGINTHWQTLIVTLACTLDPVSLLTCCRNILGELNSPEVAPIRLVFKGLPTEEKHSVYCWIIF